MTDIESLTNYDPDLDQENVINTNQVEDSSINPDDPYVIHLTDIPPVANDQTEINHDINSAFDDSSMNKTVGNSKVAFITSSNRSHQKSKKSISQDKNTEDISIPKKLSKSKQVKQYHPTSTTLTKNYVLCCKLSIAFAICCTTGFSLMPIYLYYVSQIGNNAPIAPEYSHERNTSTTNVC